MSRIRNFTNIKINDQTIHAPSAGSLTVGGIPITGGGGGGLTAVTSFTSTNRLALFSGTGGNQLIDTAIYHTFNEDNGAIFHDQDGNHAIKLMPLELVLECDSGTQIKLENNSDTIRITGNIDMNGGSLTDLAEPTYNTDAATKEYVDNAVIKTTTLTLTPINIQNLHVFPGVQLVAGQSGYVTLVEAIEFQRDAQNPGYSATGVNLYVNYTGNFVDPTQTHVWKIPATAQQAGGTGFLDGLDPIRGISYNSSSFHPLPANGAPLLMADGPITGTGGSVNVRVHYRRLPSSIDD